MGYQESWLYVEPQRQFNKLIRAYEKAEQEGYYEVAGAQPRSVVILKQPIGGIPAGAKVLWVCDDRCFHTLGGIFGGKLRCMGRFKLIPVDEGRIHIMEVTIPKNSAAAGKKLWELNLPKKIIIGCILRGDQSLIPRGDTRITEGDVLLIITSDKSKLDQIKELIEYAAS